MKKLRAYTLAEIVVTMIIIAVVAGASIKITKNKFDKILSYSYSIAYSTVKDVTVEMFKNFRTDASENYGVDVGECPSGQEAHNDTCIDIVKTVPRSGENFCLKFAEYVNTNAASSALAESGTEHVECQGNFEIDGTSLSGTADLVLRNGMIIYGLSEGPDSIDDLDKMTGGKTVWIAPEGAGGSAVNVHTNGYTIYVDVDGSSGPSALWQDIYPFYVTLEGKVVPAVGAETPSDPDDSYAGGGNKRYLQASVKLESSSNGAISWPVKSETFREAACKMGYITESTPKYCQIGSETIDPIDECQQDNVICRLQIVKPLKSF